MKHALLFLLFLSFFSFGQDVQGVVKDELGNPVLGVTILEKGKLLSQTNAKGQFRLKISNYPTQITFTLFTYEKQVISLSNAPKKMLEIVLKSTTKALNGVVVSASRRKQKIEDVSVSLQVIKPQLIENKGLTSIDEAVDQSPGVYAMEGQISIRGGSGFSYGAGSRVMVVWNDIPLLSADAADAKWVSIPMENIGQVEILKGASSVLYGSGALNGIVSLRAKDLTLKGLTKFSYQVGLYDQPKREGLRWTHKSLLTHQFSIYNGRMVSPEFGYKIAAYGYQTDGYRSGETAKRGRLSGGFVYKPKKIDHFKAGLDYSVNMGRKGVFIIWQNDTLGYTPSGGVDDPDAPGSSLSRVEALRLTIDPYIIWYDHSNNKHSLKARIYNTNNRSNSGTNANSTMYYTDYKFQRKWGKDWTVTAGLTGQWGVIHSELYSNHTSKNYAIYGQIHKKIGRFNITAGVRAEYYQADSLSPDSRVYIGKDSAFSLPVHPIFRAGLTYKAAKATFLRASFGQAYRFPSIAERFASTSVGALHIFPNPALQPEKGWSAELGIKQGFKINNFVGFVDVAGFINEYRNMMEFTFGYYIPDNLSTSLNPNDPGYLGNWYGFRAENAEHARITGVEIAVNGKGKIGPIGITAMLGYTYMNPIIVDPDSSYVYGMDGNGGLSNPESNMLKYRFHHLVRASLQFDYKHLLLGIDARYNSFMVNIDETFENGANIYLGDYLIQTQQVLPGLKEYREKHDNGDLVFDARIGYKINEHYQLHFIVNNLFNREYMTRPGDIRPPRQFVLHFQANL